MWISASYQTTEGWGIHQTILTCAGKDGPALSTRNSTVFGTGLAKWTDPDDPVLTGISSSWSLICRFLKTAQQQSNSGICYSAHSVFARGNNILMTPYQSTPFEQSLP